MKSNYIKDVFEYLFIKNKIVGVALALPLILLLIFII